MKLVIDISEETYKAIKKPFSVFKGQRTCKSVITDACVAVATGKPYKALDQEQKTGHWIDDTSLGYHISVCSCCEWRGHGDKNLIYKPNYCPNCGCRMAESEGKE